ncbi:hypothetical protein SDJN03_14684, partial [Cucurbita argyrosperma subsp. sororia]
MGSSICIKWDHDVPNANMLRFAVYVVCGSSNKNDNVDVAFAIFASMTGIGCNDPNFDNRNIVIGGFAVKGRKKLDHIWMLAWPRSDRIIRMIHHCKEIEFQFSLQFSYIQSVTPNVELKKCGTGLINMKQQDDFINRFASCVMFTKKMKSELKY